MQKATSKIKQYEALGSHLYYNEVTGDFSLEQERLLLVEESAVPSVSEILPYIKPVSYTFCIEVSNACNLACDYCFNDGKDGKVLSIRQATQQLDDLFKAFPNGEKYFVDLSGKGEPLLNIKTILEVAEYCHKKSDSIHREVLPMLVCNGTLLSSHFVELLQKHGILFGVSLDGSKEVHDRHRKTKDGQATYDLILQKVKAIPHRDYVGCAGTITNDVFDLTDAVTRLSSIFKTISFRPARGANFGLTHIGSRKWIVQYDKLAQTLLHEAMAGNLDLCYCLMNGDDYFGRFLCRAVLKQKTINRCDGGVTRFAYDDTDAIFPCSACVVLPNLAIKQDLSVHSHHELIRQGESCQKCIFKRHCGGECKIEEERLGHVNSATCSLTIRLIQLAYAFALLIEKSRPDEFSALVRFVKEKQARYRIDPYLKEFIDSNPSLSFTQAKLLFDQLNRRY